MVEWRMPHRSAPVCVLMTLFCCACLAGEERDDQSALQPVVNATDRDFRFDWPTILVGTGEYQEGPTGLTVIRFAKRVHGAVDVRGGGPGTVNTDYLRLGYDVPELDAVVFAGGSFYGLEATTAVNTALKDDRLRDGDWDNIGFTVGAIIYDFGDRRLNEIYPDKRLAQAAHRAARPGVFPLGAHGAGRFTQTGSLFKCNAHSGQGAAFRQIGELKIAAFVVVNAIGVVTKRDGSVAACYGDESWPRDLKTSWLLATYPTSRKQTPPDGKRNTTISLVVTNQKLARAQLERLATHVHTSMSRAIQPFATEFDGDVLYAVSTDELARPVDESQTTNVDLDVTAAEVMWDAVLASVPAQPQPGVAGSGPMPTARDVQQLVGQYFFSRQVSLAVTVDGGRLYAQANGSRDAYAIPRQRRIELAPLSARRFHVPGRYPLVLEFGEDHRLLINPGRWQQMGIRVGPATQPKPE